ncbi:hypothetical protein J2X54_001235 [Duganella sp. 3397]|uniref:hypothetical protein n=1 Tax=Duganella sp. 3397 TaxID=2817732 RepID=UPI002858671D|nr:hypothetical protein [Duganella sp. 3397]MDR7048787.1 hypothetical protein [Duganella sp. 3397]
MKALFALSAVFASIATPAMAADADLLRCRALADASAKLACYDAIPVGAAAAGGPAATAAAVTASAAATGRNPGPEAAMATMPATPPTASATRTQDATFGLTASQLRKSDQQDGVESTLVGTFSGWSPTTTFRLANGQAWRVVDDSSASLYTRETPKVAIKRNFFGTYFLEVEGVNQAPRVRRLE